MKVIIQIPCLNEAETLPVALADLPRELPGVDEVEWMVIDDGSTDATSDIALAHGVDHVVRHTRNLGLARAFMTGLHEALGRGADIVVNTDADNQYDARDIPALIEPIVRGEAEMVVGTRPIRDTAHFSPVKKTLQRLGSAVVRRVSGTTVEDAPSGFRAISHSAARQLNVFNDYTYTLETIIQAGHKGIAITSVPIRTNADLRPSRLMSSIPSYIRRSVLTMLRIYMTYRPFEFFALPGIIIAVIGAIPGIRFLWYYFSGDGTGHVQSLILTALLVGIGAALVIVGLLADLISVNRKLLEKIDWRLQQVEMRAIGRRRRLDVAPPGATVRERADATTPDPPVVVTARAEDEPAAPGAASSYVEPRSS